MLDKTILDRIIVGGLKSATNDHGPITNGWIVSAAKRISGHILSYLNKQETQAIKDNEFLRQQVKNLIEG